MTHHNNKKAPKGTLIAIGGAEDRENNKEVLSLVLKKAPGKRVHLVTTATKIPNEVRSVYEKAFYDLGAQSVTTSHIDDRKLANSEDHVKAIENADIVFITGGDQMRLTHYLGGTAFKNALHAHYWAGGMIAGTSAGAAAMSKIMINGGQAEKALVNAEIRVSPGLGFKDHVIFDTHVSQRNRLGRLFPIAAMNPEILGIYLDEDTGIVLRGDETEFEVIGSGSVSVVDATHGSSDITDTSKGETFSVKDFAVHNLKRGDRFCLELRSPVSSDAKPIYMGSRNEQSLPCNTQ